MGSNEERKIPSLMSTRFYLLQCNMESSIALNIACNYIENSLQFLIQVDVAKGTVGFGSGLHSWAFTLKNFAAIYANKFKIEERKLMKRLWGDNFYHPTEKKWLKDSRNGEAQRGFLLFVLDPIYKVIFLNTMAVQKNFLCVTKSNA